MTLSEEICLDLNRKFYFDDFVLTNLYYIKEKQKMEICDGLIEFGDLYVVIQIKEKTTESDFAKWLDKKVYGKAVKQIKDTIEIISQEKNIVVKDLYGQKVELNSSKKILPLIIFKADCKLPYKKVYHSETKNFNINIFSIDDYKKMLETLVMPIDIIEYLNTRQEFLEKTNFNLILDDSEEDLFYMAHIENEEDFANYFLMKRIKGQKYNENAVIDFLGIIQKYYSRRTTDNPNYKEILNVLLRFDRFGAEYFMQRWINCWDFAKKSIINFSQHIIAQNNFEKFGILFVSMVKGAKEDNNDFYIYLAKLLKQQYELDTVVVVISIYEGGVNYFVNWLYISSPYIEDKDIKKILQENNPWKRIISLNNS